MRNGTLLAIAMILGATAFGASMWYAQQRAYYEEVTDLSAVRINGTTFAVSQYEGVTGSTSPLKLRGCFVLDDPQGAIAAGTPTDDAVPLRTPDWIECFDEEAIFADLNAGRAKGVMAGLDEGDGADLYMAIYPNGRGFAWRQPNDKFKAH